MSLEETCFTENEILEQFKNEICQLDLYTSLAENDLFLLRWLRARNYDVNKAFIMLSKFLDWSNSNENYRIVVQKKWIPPELIVNEFRFKFTGYDNDGRPILWVAPARWDVASILDRGMKDDCFRYCYYIMEEIRCELEKQVKERGSVASKFIALIDSSGLTFKKLTHLETIQSMIRFFREFEAYFPELLYTCYVVNAPWIFSKLFNIVKPLLSENTIAKINIYGSDNDQWKKVLTQALPDASLPKDYGGTAEEVMCLLKSQDLNCSLQN